MLVIKKSHSALHTSLRLLNQKPCVSAGTLCRILFLEHVIVCRRSLSVAACSNITPHDWLPIAVPERAPFKPGMDGTKGPRMQKINKWRDMLKINQLRFLLQMTKSLKQPLKRPTGEVGRCHTIIVLLRPALLSAEPQLQQTTSADLILLFFSRWSKVDYFIKMGPENWFSPRHPCSLSVWALFFHRLGTEPQFVPSRTRCSRLISLCRHINIYWIFMLNCIQLNLVKTSYQLVIICACCSLNQRAHWKSLESPSDANSTSIFYFIS